ncbi:MAG: hypothetical protein KJ920_10740 [Actinobacteria bacterium]|nr:hypothetical protein [Actinomycetota bacterium]MBU4392901.1 hypothetical protein [Actinomycetota bacterium]MCG2820049.1 hypothetical protein [Actinomycetes bacterium]
MASVEDFMNNWDEFIRERIQILEASVDVAEPFDRTSPIQPSDLKDKYFERCNSDGALLINNRLPHFADLYFGILLMRLDDMIDARRQHEPDFDLNKGQIYVNYGISQLISGKTDEGIAHILYAFKEDEPYHDPTKIEKVITGNKLYEQFEQKAYRHLWIYSERYRLKLKNAADLEDASKFVQQMKMALDKIPLRNRLENRIGLLGTILDLDTNMALLKEHEDNIYTMGRVAVLLRQLCTFVESILKAKAIAGKWPSVNEKTMLRSLLENEKFVNWPVLPCYFKAGLGSAFNDIDFRDKVQQVLHLAESNKTTLIAKAATLMLLIRNYSSHNFYAGEIELVRSRFHSVPMIYFLLLYVLFEVEDTP